jgi:mRNA interferase RelE/StbE
VDYQIAFKASADKSLDKLPQHIRARVIAKIQSLADQPRPPGSSKLAGADGLWRVRLGDYRVVYLIDDQAKTVGIRIVAHRREVYRGL